MYPLLHWSTSAVTCPSSFLFCLPSTPQSRLYYGTLEHPHVCRQHPGDGDPGLLCAIRVVSMHILCPCLCSAGVTSAAEAVLFVMFAPIGTKWRLTVLRANLTAEGNTYIRSAIELCICWQECKFYLYPTCTRTNDSAEYRCTCTYKCVKSYCNPNGSMCNIRYAALLKMPREIMCVHVYIRTYMYVCTVHMYSTYMCTVHMYVYMTYVCM